MIFRPDSLSHRSKLYLNKWQSAIDAETSREAKITASEKFLRKNIPGNRTFREVRLSLGNACPGNSLCVYCESSGFERIDHVLPRSRFPEATFCFENYIPCCALCNEIKSSRCVHLSCGLAAECGEAEVLAMGAGFRSAFPDPWLIDIYQLVGVDIVDTFVLYPRTSLGHDDVVMANCFIDLLSFDKRDILARRRRASYQRYLSLVADYLQSPDLDRKRRVVSAIVGSDHRLVWHEMKMRASSLPALADVSRFIAVCPDV